VDDAKPVVLAVLPPAHIQPLLRPQGNCVSAKTGRGRAPEGHRRQDRQRQPKLKAFSHRSRRTCDTMTFPPLEYCMEVRTRKHGPKTTVQEMLDLPALRQHKGISLREIADSTKISIRFLQAIEQGDFNQLPGGIYTTSYLRQYAREIGFEETTLLAYYQAVTAASS
jgi:hypothetical protein